MFGRSKRSSADDSTVGFMRVPENSDVEVLAHGWVSKQSIKGRFGKKWTTRYFVLHSIEDGVELRYYESAHCTGANLQGVIELVKDSIAEPIVAASPLLRNVPTTDGPVHGFSFSFVDVKTRRPAEMVCCVLEQEQRDKWIAAFNAAAKALSEPAALNAAQSRERAATREMNWSRTLSIGADTAIAGPNGSASTPRSEKKKLSEKKEAAPEAKAADAEARKRIEAVQQKKRDAEAQFRARMAAEGVSLDPVPAAPTRPNRTESRDSDGHLKDGAAGTDPQGDDDDDEGDEEEEEEEEESELDKAAFLASQAKATIDEATAQAREFALGVIKRCVAGKHGGNFLKNAVSGNKKRYVDKRHKLDLDLTYITPRLIAMGIPSVGAEAVYRNDLDDVQRFFDLRHRDKDTPAAAAAAADGGDGEAPRGVVAAPGGSGTPRARPSGTPLWLIVNLCIEEDRGYDVELFGGAQHVRRMGFFDHNPCPFELLPRICEAIHSWLGADERHVAAVHCKAGKGRTGMVVAAYLVHAGVCAGGDEALEYFGKARTHDSKGVTIPSQKRWVRQYANLVKAGLHRPPLATPPTLRLRRIVLNGVPRFDGKSDPGCDPYFRVAVPPPPDASEAEQQQLVEVYDYRRHLGGEVPHLSPADGGCTLPLLHPANVPKPAGLLVSGSFKVTFFDEDAHVIKSLDKDDKMFHFWWHTAFEAERTADGELRVVLAKHELDKAVKDKKHAKFDADFSIELYMADDETPAPPGEEAAAAPAMAAEISAEA